MFAFLFIFTVVKGDLKYCEAPDFTVTPVKGYTPKMFQLVFRHGDRSPWATYEGDNANYYCGLTQQLRFLSVQGMESHEFVHVKTEIDKEKNPYAKHNYGGDCQNGQLTRKGLDQLALLGDKVRKAFTGENNFLPEHLNETEVWARSTHVWRVIQSAESFLKHLYPSNKRNPDARIPINVVPDEIDYAVDNPERCPRFSELQSELFTKYFVEELKMREQEPYKSLLEKCERHFGVLGSPWFDGFFDILQELECNNLEYPCFDVENEDGSGTTKECFSVEDLNNLVTLVYKEHIYRFFDNETIPLGRLQTGIYLGDLLKALQEKIDGTNVYKYMHYHAHDTTIYPMVSLLEGDYSEWPPYASWIMIELYEKDGKHFVRGHYNNNKLDLKFCEKNEDGLCTWESFYNHLIKKVPTKEMCQKQHN